MELAIPFSMVMSILASNIPTKPGTLNPVVPLKWIEYGVYGPPKAIFHLLKGDYEP